MDSAKPAKKHCFIEEEEDDDDMGAGFSGNHTQNYPLVSRPVYYHQSTMQSMRRRSSLRSISSLSPRFAGNSTLRFYEEPHQAYFLDACFLCKKPLGQHKDIFMYRGDTPFCSEECRQEQIEMDEAKEKSWNLSASMKALRKKDQRKSTSPNKQDCTLRSSTVAAA